MKSTEAFPHEVLKIFRRQGDLVAEQETKITGKQKIQEELKCSRA